MEKDKEREIDEATERDIEREGGLTRKRER